jgi:hypothetical protein
MIDASVCCSPRDLIHRAAQLLCFFVLSSIIAEQCYLSFRYSITDSDFQQHALDPQSFIASQRQVSVSVSAPVPPHTNNNTSSSFGACLMIKEDNNLLFEWLAYHYTVLPLRYIVIGSDVGNTQDPTDILSRWKTAQTDLQYWVWNASDFVNRHGRAYNVNSSANSNVANNGSNVENDKDSILQAHHDFVNRQKGFVTTCSEFLKKQGVQWTTYIDSDEFVVLNRLGEDEMEGNDENKNGQKKIHPESYQARRNLPPASQGSDKDKDTTVVDVLQTMRHTGYWKKPSKSNGNCYTLPRLLVGSLENATCPGAADVNELARRDYNRDEMSTLRFVQHSQKGDFKSSKFGKVVMDLSGMSEETVASEPRNIHRPYKSECGPAVVQFSNAVLYLSHYIGTWERYSSRLDGRRNRQEWQQRAYFDHGVSCDQEVHTWLPRFIAQMGRTRARFLLGVDDSDSPI